MTSDYQDGPGGIPAYTCWHDILSALAYTCGDLSSGNPPGKDRQTSYNDLTRFLVTQQENLPDYLRLGMRVATALFDASALPKGRLFHKLPADRRHAHVLAWKGSSLGFQRDLIRYYASLSTLALFSRNEQPVTSYSHEWRDSKEVIRNPDQEIRTEIAVVGSGPGGAITACTLAEAGKGVLLIEEGPFLPLTSCPPFSMQEMLQKYRNGGQNVALGKDKVAYVEGRCVGGGSEINSGLYHRTPPEVLESWEKRFEVQALGTADLLPHFEQCEKDLSVSLLKTKAPAASLRLHEGAAKLGWKSLEVPRWFHQDSQLPGGGKRQSMTETYIPRFLKAGGRLLPEAKALQLKVDGNRWRIEVQHRDGKISIIAEQLFVAAGAVQTPALLLRSGIKSNIGRSLQLHPTVKVAAHFPEEVNSANMGVPVHQVKEFAPAASFGCSISSPAYLALALLDHQEALHTLRSSWQHMANYYVMSSGASSGSVSVLPGFKDPLVRYSMKETARTDLGKGLRNLCRLLLESGANMLYPGTAGSGRITSLKDIERLPETLPAETGNLMTIHLFSSCPMGERKDICAVDSFGRVHGMKNLWISDASLLCSAPGVNPQGSIMAIARRNVMAFLKK